MDWVSIIPPLVAIFVVFWKKEVIMALLLAVLCAEALILTQGSDASVIMAPVTSMERVIEVASSPGNTRILLFSVLVGALLAYIRDSGGVTARGKLADQQRCSPQQTASGQSDHADWYRGIY